MKKFTIICIILFIANVGCKKMEIGGDGLCACSPMTPPELLLAIKNTAGEDLLNEKTIGAYSKGEIQFFSKDHNGKVIPVNFSINPPFRFGDEQFNFSQLQFYVHEFNVSEPQTAKRYYLKLRENELYELDIQFNKGTPGYIQHVLINNKEAEKDKRVAQIRPVFYLTPTNQ